MPEGRDLDPSLEIGESGTEDVVENLNDKIYVAVDEALQMIKEHDVPCWQDVCRRVYKYFCTSATMTTPGKSWEECARSFVKRAFQGYASAGGRKDWFYAIDFSLVWWT